MNVRLCVAIALLATLALSTGSASAATALPAHVYAPYFETWTSDGITTLAQQSGARYFTLAFLETLGKTSCTLAWNGSTARRSPSGRYLADIASLRAIGGDVIPSFGGWSADQGGTEIGDSCKDVNAIAAAYEALVTTLRRHPPRHGYRGPLAHQDRRASTGATRRSSCCRTGRPPTAAPCRSSTPCRRAASGLEASGLAVLQNAVANGVRIDVVNPMVFDYYDRVTTDMGGAGDQRVQGLHAQLHTLCPAKTSAQLWAMQGATIMNGLDDYPKKTEVDRPRRRAAAADFAHAERR